MIRGAGRLNKPPDVVRDEVRDGRHLFPQEGDEDHAPRLITRARFRVSRDELEGEQTALRRLADDMRRQFPVNVAW